VGLEGQSDKALAYVTFRLSLGIGGLMHGLVRLPIMATSAADMAKGTILPGWFIYAFGLVLPFLEALIGISLIVGLLTKWALLAGSLLMSILNLWNLPALGLGNGRRSNDLCHRLFPGPSIS
jgi:thiosulfate dehydrogenase [quinone] large subunit